LIQYLNENFQKGSKRGASFRRPNCRRAKTGLLGVGEKRKHGVSYVSGFIRVAGREMTFGDRFKGEKEYDIRSRGRPQISSRVRIEKEGPMGRNDENFKAFCEAVRPSKVTAKTREGTVGVGGSSVCQSVRGRQGENSWYRARKHPVKGRNSW